MIELKDTQSGFDDLGFESWFTRNRYYKKHMDTFRKIYIQVVLPDRQEIKELGDRVMKAEMAMAKAYAWPNDGDPRTEHVKASFREYRENYPEAYTN